MAFQQQDNFLGRGWSFPPTFNLQSKEVQMTEKVEGGAGAEISSGATTAVKGSMVNIN